MRVRSSSGIRIVAPTSASPVISSVILPESLMPLSCPISRPTTSRFTEGVWAHAAVSPKNKKISRDIFFMGIGLDRIWVKLVQFHRQGSTYGFLGGTEKINRAIELEVAAVDTLRETNDLIFCFPGEGL